MRSKVSPSLPDPPAPPPALDAAAPKAGARRAAYRTAAEIASYADWMSSQLTDDYTVQISCDGVPVTAEHLKMIASDGARVMVVSEHVVNKTQRREDPFIVRETAPGTKEEHIADLIKSVAERERQSTQTIGELHAQLRASIQSQGDILKVLGKLTKSVSKSYEKTAKYRRKLEKKEGSLTLLKEIKEFAGTDNVEELISLAMKGEFNDWLGLRSRKGRHSADPGGTETVSSPAPNGADPGGNNTAGNVGPDALPPRANIQ